MANLYDSCVLKYIWMAVNVSTTNIISRKIVENPMAPPAVGSIIDKRFSAAIVERLTLNTDSAPIFCSKFLIQLILMSTFLNMICSFFLFFVNLIHRAHETRTANTSKFTCFSQKTTKNTIFFFLQLFQFSFFFTHVISNQHHLIRIENHNTHATESPSIGCTVFYTVSPAVEFYFPIKR